MQEGSSAGPAAPWPSALPPRGKESNWLPSPPEGLFRLNDRIYLPDAVAKDPATLGKYLPPVRRI